MSVIESVIGWLAPPQCLGCGREGSALCLICAASEVIPYGERCWNCGALSAGCRTCAHCRWLGGPRYVWINSDYAGLIKELVLIYKFGHQRAAAQPIAGLMAQTLLAFSSDSELARLNYLVVPVPTATSRVRQRGFDHSVLIASRLASTLGMSMQNVLLRIGHSRQLGASRHERLRQLESSYLVRDEQKIVGRNILLVDDVLTTGGTICAAAKTLRRAGAQRVDALILAKRL